MIERTQNGHLGEGESADTPRRGRVRIPRITENQRDAIESQRNLIEADQVALKDVFERTGVVLAEAQAVHELASLDLESLNNIARGLRHAHAEIEFAKSRLLMAYGEMADPKGVAGALKSLFAETKRAYNSAQTRNGDIAEQLQRYEAFVRENHPDAYLPAVVLERGGALRGRGSISQEVQAQSLEEVPSAMPASVFVEGPNATIGTEPVREIVQEIMQRPEAVSEILGDIQRLAEMLKKSSRGNTHLARHVDATVDVLSRVDANTIMHSAEEAHELLARGQSLLELSPTNPLRTLAVTNAIGEADSIFSAMGEAVKNDSEKVSPIRLTSGLYAATAFGLSFSGALTAISVAMTSGGIQDMTQGTGELVIDATFGNDETKETLHEWGVEDPANWGSWVATLVGAGLSGGSALGIALYRGREDLTPRQRAFYRTSLFISGAGAVALFAAVLADKQVAQDMGEQMRDVYGGDDEASIVGKVRSLDTAMTALPQKTSEQLLRLVQGEANSGTGKLTMSTLSILQGYDPDAEGETADTRKAEWERMWSEWDAWIAEGGREGHVTALEKVLKVALELQTDEAYAGMFGDGERAEALLALHKGGRSLIDIVKEKGMPSILWALEQGIADMNAGRGVTNFNELIKLATQAEGLTAGSAFAETLNPLNIGQGLPSRQMSAVEGRMLDALKHSIGRYDSFRNQDIPQLVAYLSAVERAGDINLRAREKQGNRVVSVGSGDLSKELAHMFSLEELDLSVADLERAQGAISAETFSSAFAVAFTEEGRELAFKTVKETFPWFDPTNPAHVGGGVMSVILAYAFVDQIGGWALNGLPTRPGRWLYSGINARRRDHFDNEFESGMEVIHENEKAIARAVAKHMGSALFAAHDLRSTNVPNVISSMPASLLEAMIVRRIREMGAQDIPALQETDEDTKRAFVSRMFDVVGNVPAHLGRGLGVDYVDQKVKTFNAYSAYLNSLASDLATLDTTGLLSKFRSRKSQERGLEQAHELLGAIIPNGADLHKALHKTLETRPDTPEYETALEDLANSTSESVTQAYAELAEMTLLHKRYLESRIAHIQERAGKSLFEAGGLEFEGRTIFALSEEEIDGLSKGIDLQRQVQLCDETLSNLAQAGFDLDSAKERVEALELETGVWSVPQAHQEIVATSVNEIATFSRSNKRSQEARRAYVEGMNAMFTAIRDGLYVEGGPLEQFKDRLPSWLQGRPIRTRFTSSGVGRGGLTVSIDVLATSGSSRVVAHTEFRPYEEQLLHMEAESDGSVDVRKVTQQTQDQLAQWLTPGGEAWQDITASGTEFMMEDALRFAFENIDEVAGEGVVVFDGAEKLRTDALDVVQTDIETLARAHMLQTYEAVLSGARDGHSAIGAWNGRQKEEFHSIRDAIASGSVERTFIEAFDDMIQEVEAVIRDEKITLPSDSTFRLMVKRGELPKIVFRHAERETEIPLGKQHTIATVVRTATQSG